MGCNGVTRDYVVKHQYYNGVVIQGHLNNEQQKHIEFWSFRDVKHPIILSYASFWDSLFISAKTICGKGDTCLPWWGINHSPVNFFKNLSTPTQLTWRWIWHKNDSDAAGTDLVLTKLALKVGFWINKNNNIIKNNNNNSIDKKETNIQDVLLT